MPAAGFPRTWRLFAGFAALPFVDALLAYIGFPLMSRMEGAFSPDAAHDFAALTGALGLVVTLSGAVPVVTVLMKRGRLSLKPLMLAGAALGNAPFAVYVAWLVPFAVTHILFGTLGEHLMPLSDLIAGVLRAITVGSIMGALSGAVFWVIAVAGSNPPLESAIDRDGPT